MKKLLAFVVALVVFSAGCLEKPHSYRYTLPHAKEVIVVKDFKLTQGVRLGGSAVVPQIVVDFKTFQEHATGTVYVDVVDSYSPIFSLGTNVELGFYTIVNGTVWVSYVVAENAPIDYTLVVNGTTVIVERRRGDVS
ncbi:putative integral membrane protein [Thermococcus prieurii virus 1]|uniref:putative integral membrane protein n=1 Tax=Thermococcus prieurii virus 1 TaxID=1115696 RepID=UPI00024FB213|nr:putative integral membrane protein [Thermococcus prieurii virus 1]AEY69062.1 putative membrane-bound lipoprotein [Thermococcus prieurii virus 1]AFA44825.1 putative integral membrane protein [Thermococcus prieurii virus 1]